jgi:predicted MPP superfamily phosphohydrolase
MERFMANIKKTQSVIGILTGGGDVPGLNPAIRAVTIRALREGYRVLGIRHGWGGLVEMERDRDKPQSDHIIELSEETVNRIGRTGGTSEAALLGNRPDGRFTVLLKHRPQLDPVPGGKFDLQLSGHTHHGQIFPFRLLTRLVFPLLAGDHPVPGGGILHVSRGTGTWGPPMRFLAPPEITVVDIERAPTGPDPSAPGTP